MVSAKTFLKISALVFVALFLTSILTIESEQIDRNSKIKFPVCIDSGVELASTAYYDPIPYLLNASSGTFLFPGTEHIITQIYLSSRLYRGPPAAYIM